MATAKSVQEPRLRIGIRDSGNSERLDGENRLLLTPSSDPLFDRGFITFRSDGRLLVSPVAHRSSLARMGVPVDRELEVGGLSAGQARLLEFLREQVGSGSRAAASRSGWSVEERLEVWRPLLEARMSLAAGFPGRGPQCVSDAPE